MGPILSIAAQSSARSQRICAYLGLVNAIAKRVHRQCPSAELQDLRQIGAQALIEETDGGRQITKLRIRGAMLSSIRRERRHWMRRAELHDMPAPLGSFELTDLLLYVPPNCSDLLQLRLEGYTRKAAAAKLGISDSQARKLETQAVEKMQQLSKGVVSFQRSALSRRAA